MACSDWCPDCGIHNSFQILAKNLEFARKELALAESAEKDFADHLIGDALENIVSAFDGFGREICARKAVDIHFQNLGGADAAYRMLSALILRMSYTERLGKSACRVFQKRHLLAHKMGVVDQDYVKVNDPQAILGAKSP